MPTVNEAGPDREVDERIRALEEQVAGLKKEVAATRRANSVCIVCFSGEWDKLFAALTIANGALALGQEVHLFFTFWAVSALRAKGQAGAQDKSFIQSMLSSMLPTGIMSAPLSKMNYFGISKKMLRKLMAKEGVDDIDVLMKEAKELGVQLYLCETSAGLFGLKCEELEEGDKLKQCGVTTFLSFALKAKVVLFI